MILDVGLPDGNGLNLITQIKIRHPETGILILSARNSMDDKVAGLDFGADDYLGKPFHLAELNARIRAIYRRRYFNGQEKIAFGQVELLLNEKLALVNHQQLDLTRKEFDLLVFMFTNPNRVLSKESIAEHLWGDSIDSSDSFDFVYSHIKNIRKKIHEKGGEDCITTVYGLGYKCSVE
jgi:DNA-binding response OmpR family regulator